MGDNNRKTQDDMQRKVKMRRKRVKVKKPKDNISESTSQKGILGKKRFGKNKPKGPKGKKITVVPILRAGLGMMDGVLENVPSARISVVGMYRNEETLEPVPYFQKLVSNIDERMALIVDPMLATGGSVIATIDLLKKAGCSSIKVLVLVAAPEGIAALEKAHPDVELYTASIDQGLNEHGYIIPGLGDAGDKIFGTK